MGFKLLPHFSNHHLRQSLTTAFPLMLFLTPQSSNSSSTGNGMLRSKSEENLNKLSNCMEKMDDDVSQLFMEFHQTDFREDPDLLLLLSEFFTTSKSVSELCESLKIFLEKTEHKECFLVDKALLDFHDEKLGYGDLLEASFRKTSADLRNFNEFYNSCDDEEFLAGDFIGKIQMCHDDLANMVVKLETTMKEINKKLKRVRGLRAIVAAAVLVPVIALMSVSKIIGGSLPVESLTTVAASKWKKPTEALKQELKAMTSMERGTLVALKEIEKLGRLVSRLETVERSIRVTAEFAVKKRASVEVAMGGMENKQKKLKSTLVDLEKERERCEGFVEFGRSVARQKIAEFLSCSG